MGLAADDKMEGIKAKKAVKRQVLREAAGYLPNGKPADPLEMLKEIEAYLTFRLMTDTPTVPAGDMRQMKTDIADALRENGIEVNYQGR